MPLQLNPIYRRDHRIVIKQVIAKGAKSESDQKQGKTEGGQLFCFLADFCHATSQIFQR